MTVYIDASAIVAVVGSESRSDAIDAFIQTVGAAAVVSDFALVESAAALARNGRIGRWTISEIARVYSDLDAWTSSIAERIDIVPDDIADATDFVRRSGLSLRAPDAIHIAVARRLDATLLSLDGGMIRAAQILDIACINPAEDPVDRKT